MVIDDVFRNISHVQRERYEMFRIAIVLCVLIFSLDKR